MTRQGRGRGRRTGAAFVAVGLLLGALSVAPFRAGPASAVELFSFELTAGARGFQYFNESAADADLAEPGGGVGETRAELASGPIGYGLSAVAFPGALIANGGTLLLVLRPDTPAAVANQLNVPLRAEARSGQNPPETTNTQAPGTTLKASATGDKVTADANVASAGGVPGNFGRTNAHSETRNGTDGGISEGNSEVQDIDLGAVKIKSVTSTASAKTDGTKAEGNAVTTVTGLEIGGQPATIDEDGLKIGSAGAPANAVANQIANAALASGGFDIRLTEPVEEVEGATAKVTAGSLIITQKSEGGGLGTLVFGGASAMATGAPGDPSLLTDVDLGSDTSFDTGSVDTGSTSFDTGTSSFDTGGLTDTGATTVDTPLSTPTGGAAEEVALGPTRNAASGGKPIKAGAVLLGVVAAAFMAFGMRRLSDNVLVEGGSVITCSLEGPR